MAPKLPGRVQAPQTVECEMPRFYMHLHECGTTVEDPEGQDYVDLDAAIRFAEKTARGIMSAEVIEGRLCLSCRIVIVGEAGDEVGSVPFRQALVVSGL
jgi:hypothetical protein